MAAITQSVALFGVTGELGRAFLDGLEEQAAFTGRLRLFASEKSIEETRLFRDKPYLIENPDGADFSDVSEAILALPADIADDLAPRLLAAGVRVWDATGHLKNLPQAVNIKAQSEHDLLMVCDDALAIALLPLLQAITELTTVVAADATVLLPASLKGRRGVRELASQTGELLNGRGISPTVWPQQLSFNVLAADGSFERNGPTLSEKRLQQALQTLLPALPVLSLRRYVVPVFYGSTIDLRLTLADKPSRLALTTALKAVVGLQLHDRADFRGLPTPVGEGISDQVHVSRLLLEGSEVRLSVLCDPLRAGLVRSVLDSLLKCS